MLNIVNTELKLVTSGPDGKPWMLSFHFDNIIKETGSNQMSFWYAEHPTMLAIQHMREDAMLWANSEPVIDPFDTYEEHELPRKPVRDIPKYMFAERPVTSSTWLELTSAQLDTYMLSDGTALLVDPQNREYCYVFWDEAEQCSNPYPNHAEAVMARTVYIANL